MARILEFETRDARMARLREAETPDSKPEAILTPLELYNRYNEKTLTECRILVDFYKKTGTWDEECEQRMIAVVRTLQEICGILARKGNPNAQDAG